METSIVVAIIAGFVSFIGLVITKEQKVSEFRQVWINTLRDDISKFIGQIDKVTKLVILNKSSNANEKEETSKNVIINSIEMRELQSKITLLLNTKEEMHNKLVELLDEVIFNIKNLKDNTDSMDKLTRLSQLILKDEWERVKKGELWFRVTKWVIVVLFVGLAIFAAVEMCQCQLPQS